ncbi:helix-turn-helix domain-containing protein [Dictyobacter formicarum]|uniref:Helix-turn-helix domain-containing protein n=1 Tax=Dictyobacter formicarum TaxID=2778368 RepID=A0ABQ3VM25_9CHLR|nr:helix-turn-helix domain-containing protein [Dictyobacter formicarum]GHO86441.1 hypothetical protein KSZ_44470 [Dictyobacter formicarum]
MPRTRSQTTDTQSSLDRTATPSEPLPPPPEALMDTKELLSFLKLGKTKISELINREGLPVYKFGNAYRFDRNEVWQWLQNRRQMR